MQKTAIFLLCSMCAAAETKTMTLREAIAAALAQNPDIVLARLDQQKARDQVTIARDPFAPKVYAGSGLAWTSGFPASIDGAAPSIFQLRTQMSLFDRQQSYLVSAQRERLRGSEIEVGRQQDEVAYRVASLYLDAEQAARSLETAQRETESLEKVLDYSKARAAEGRELPIEVRKADLAVRKSKNTMESLTLDLLNAETSLGMALGMQPDDRIRAVQNGRGVLEVPVAEQESIDQAIEQSHELRRLESNIQAKTLEIKGYKSARWPRVNLIAQYELFAKYYYQNYYPVFSRNSGQLGASIEIPVLLGKSSQAYMSQAETDIARYHVEADRTRARITADLHRGFQEVKRAESTRDYALEDLDIAREQLTINLAQETEGRLSIAVLEQARALENEKWRAYYDSLYLLERARLNLMRQTGTLLAALR